MTSKILFLYVFYSSGALCAMQVYNPDKECVSMIDAIKANKYEEVRRCLGNDLEDPIEGLNCIVEELDEEQEKKLDKRIIDSLIRHASAKKRLEAHKNNLSIKAGRRHSYLKEKIDEAIASKKRVSMLISEFDTKAFFETQENERKQQSPKKKPIKERRKPSRISYKKWGAVVLISCLVVWFNFRYQQLGKRNIPPK